jgi:F-type H+-transporting ATPase subunit epsilon
VHGGHESPYFVAAGFLQVDGDRVIVLVDSAEPREEIDVERAKRALAEATERLRGMPEQDSAYRVESARVRRAAARVHVAGR